MRRGEGEEKEVERVALESLGGCNGNGRTQNI